MSKTAFRWSLAVIALVTLSLLSVIGKHSPEALANRAQPTQMPAGLSKGSKPTTTITVPQSPAISQEQRERERQAKFDAVRRGEVSFCEAFKSDLQTFTGIKQPCLTDSRR